MWRVATLWLPFVAAAGVVVDTAVLPAGLANYTAFRIPGVVATRSAVVVVAEGRFYGCDDFYGLHTIVSRRSLDGGVTWLPLQVVADPVALFECANASLPASGRCQFWDPTPLWDANTNTLHLLAAYASSDDHSGRLGGHQALFHWVSKDEGATWSAPQNLTSSFPHIPRPTPANGHGIQLRSGRLLSPAYGEGFGPGAQSLAFLSDDHGASWRLSADSVGPDTGEGSVAQLPNGTLIYNLRNDNSSEAGCGGVAHCRQQAVSNDGGDHWGNLVSQPGLPDPECKGGVASMSATQPWVVYANDASTSSRTNVTLTLSPDGGSAFSWRTVVSEAGGYADVIALDAATAAVAYEADTCSIHVAVVGVPV